MLVFALLMPKQLREYFSSVCVWCIVDVAFKSHGITHTIILTNALLVLLTQLPIAVKGRYLEMKSSFCLIGKHLYFNQ